MKFSVSAYFILLVGLAFSERSFAFSHTISTDSVTETCSDCPTEVVVTDNTIYHSLQHFPQRIFPTRDEMKKMARADRSTTILNSDISIEDLVVQFSSPSFSVRPDKKATRLLSEGSESIGFLISNTSAQYILVICVRDACGDDSYGEMRDRIYLRNEVISIYPVCGPEVFSIEKPRQRNGQSQIRVTQRTCKIPESK